jgi:hypothetical protein
VKALPLQFSCKLAWRDELKIKYLFLAMQILLFYDLCTLYDTHSKGTNAKILLIIS